MRIVNVTRELGVLISATGPGGNVLKIRPPLVLQREHADILVDTLRKALARLD
jgi:4-aminobutyrate aminotransferase-like enzyme